MRILLLVHGFNGLAQRIYVELARDGHELSVEFDIHDDVTREAVELFRPDLIVAPFLKRAIPAVRVAPRSVPGRASGTTRRPWPRGAGLGDTCAATALGRHRVAGRRGEFDAGPVWASDGHSRCATRARAACTGTRSPRCGSAVRAASRGSMPANAPLDAAARVKPAGKPLRRRNGVIDWQRDDTDTVCASRTLPTAPGVPDELAGTGSACSTHTARPVFPAPRRTDRTAHGAVCRATRDGAVWIGQLQPVAAGGRGFKRPAVMALGARARRSPGERGRSIHRERR